jgi:hypothetical protein
MLIAEQGNFQLYTLLEAQKKQLKAGLQKNSRPTSKLESWEAVNGHK